MTMKTEIPIHPEWAAPLAKFLAEIRSHVSEGTVYQRSYHLRRFAAHVDRAPVDVTSSDISRYLGEQPWKAATKSAARSALRSFFLWAKHKKITSSNPAKRVKVPKRDRGKPRPAPTTAVEQARATSDERVALMLDLASNLGLRCCEICKVHTSDIVEDLDGWSLKVVGKGSRERSVPLTRRMALKLRSLKPGYLFPGNVDGHLSPGRVSKLLSQALPDGVTAHMLRHRFASRSYQQKRDLLAVRELLGHASVATTEIYTQVPKNALREAVEFIDEAA